MIHALVREPIIVGGEYDVLVTIGSEGM